METTDDERFYSVLTHNRFKVVRQNAQASYLSENTLIINAILFCKKTFQTSIADPFFLKDNLPLGNTIEFNTSFITNTSIHVNQSSTLLTVPE